MTYVFKEEEEEEDLIDPATEIKEGCADSACVSLKETNVFQIFIVHCSKPLWERKAQLMLFVVFILLIFYKEYLY